MEGPTLTSLWSAVTRFSRLSRLSKMCGPLTCLFWLLGPLSLLPPPRNSAQLVRPDLTDCMFIHVHRDAAAYDFWRFHQLPDGSLVSPSPATSSRVYKIIVDGFFLEDAVRKVGSKISNFLTKNDPSCPLPLPSVALLATVADNLASVSFARPDLLSHQMALVNNALASERRMRHQNKLRVDQVFLLRPR